MRSAAHLALALALLAGGCLDDTLARRSEVSQWRVLAIVADRPVAGFEDVIRFDAVAVRPDGSDARHGEDGVTFRWTLCLRPEAVPGLGGLQFDPEQPSQGCGASELPPLPLEVGAEGTGVLDLPELRRQLRELTGMDLSAEMLAAAAVGLGIPEELAARVLAETGLPAVAELIVCEGVPAGACARGTQAARVVAFKRFLLTSAEGARGTNPPPPRFRVCRSEDACRAPEAPGDEWLAARAEAPFLCAPAAGLPLVASPGEALILDPEHGAPSGEAGRPPWLEAYVVLDIEGRFVTVEERAYYSFFSTAGRFAQEVTRSPVEQERWRAPADPGVHPFWIVVRDGHGGTSACRAELEVR